MFKDNAFIRKKQISKHVFVSTRFNEDSALIMLEVGQINPLSLALDAAVWAGRLLKQQPHLWTARVAVNFLAGWTLPSARFHKPPYFFPTFEAETSNHPFLTSSADSLSTLLQKLQDCELLAPLRELDSCFHHSDQPGNCLFHQRLHAEDS